MSTAPSCPACGIPLGLFTPRESTAHVNACLDAQDAPSPAEASARPECAVCARDLTLLTPAARAEHANRCADTTLPLGEEPHRPARRPRTCPAVASPARPSKLCDESVRRLLELLGLARYASRFADEEIDMDALRLLSDADFAQLRISEAARRRIADALHSVHALGEVGAAGGRGEDVVQTQQFGESRLGKAMRRGVPLLGAESSDEGSEFRHSPVKQAKNVDTGAKKAAAVDESDRASSLSRTGADSYENACGGESSWANLDVVQRRAIIASQVDSDDESSDLSDLRDLEEELKSTSQISLHAKLDRWRSQEVLREEMRHKRNMQQIQTRYEQMRKRVCTARDKRVETHLGEQDNTDDEAQASRCERPYSSATMGGNGTSSEVLDLTQDISEDDGTEVINTPYATRQIESVKVPESIVISSASGPRKEGACGSSLKGRDKMTSSLSPHATACEDYPKHQLDSRLFSSSDEDEDEGLYKGGGMEGIAESQLLVRAEEEERLDSNDEVMNLVETDEENIGVPRVSKNGEVSGLDSEDDKGSGKFENEVTRNDDALRGTSAKPPSRLKKPRTVSRAEVVDAIRVDKVLYDDILVMETVAFTRVLESVRAYGVNVSKKALTEVLQKEGISFKPEAPKKGENATKYFSRLNCDFD